MNRFRAIPAMPSWIISSRIKKPYKLRFTFSKFSGEIQSGNGWVILLFLPVFFLLSCQGNSLQKEKRQEILITRRHDQFVYKLVPPKYQQRALYPWQQ